MVIEDSSPFIADEFYVSDDEEEYQFSDLSSMSESEEGRKTVKSIILPEISSVTVLNFTQNYRFSYFAIPGYVKEKNKRVSANFDSKIFLQFFKTLATKRDSLLHFSPKMVTRSISSVIFYISLYLRLKTLIN